MQASCSRHPLNWTYIEKQLARLNLLRRRHATLSNPIPKEVVNALNTAGAGVSRAKPGRTFSN